MATPHAFNASAWVSAMLALGRRLSVVDGRLCDMDPAGPYPPGGKDKEIALYWQRERAPDGRALVVAECIRRGLVDREDAA